MAIPGIVGVESIRCSHGSIECWHWRRDNGRYAIGEVHGKFTITTPCSLPLNNIASEPGRRAMASWRSPYFLPALRHLYLTKTVRSRPGT